VHTHSPARPLMGHSSSRDAEAHPQVEDTQVSATHKDFFRGEASDNAAFGCIHNLIRQDTVEVVNDPRIYADNVVFSRLGAYSTIVTAAIFIASVTCNTLITMQSKHETWEEFVGLTGMIIVFIMNLFSVLVITQQYYQIVRLSTGGASGFDIATSYYLNKNIRTLRHLASGAFFYSIPIFQFCIGVMVYVKVTPARQAYLWLACWPASLFCSFIFLGSRRTSSSKRSTGSNISRHQSTIISLTKCRHPTE